MYNSVGSGCFTGALLAFRGRLHAFQFEQNDLLRIWNEYPLDDIILFEFEMRSLASLTSLQLQVVLVPWLLVAEDLQRFP